VVGGLVARGECAVVEGVPLGELLAQQAQLRRAHLSLERVSLERRAAPR